tara:strand:- start:62 stop:268 length:207 start_codon:yes stop_codon:yes gene_type:complete
LAAARTVSTLLAIAVASQSNDPDGAIAAAIAEAAKRHSRKSFVGLNLGSQRSAPVIYTYRVALNHFGS